MGRGNKERFEVETVIEALRLSQGVKWTAAKRLGCARKTVSNYIRRHPEVAAVYKEERETLVDLAEIELITKIKESFWPAVKFTLSTLGKDRGYTERTEVTGPGGGSITVDHVFQTALNKTYGEGKDPESDPESDPD